MFEQRGHRIRNCYQPAGADFFRGFFFQKNLAKIFHRTVVAFMFLLFCAQVYFISMRTVCHFNAYLISRWVLLSTVFDLKMDFFRKGESRGKKTAGVFINLNFKIICCRRIAKSGGVGRPAPCFELGGRIRS
jgi:hypothetical protein